MKEDIESLLLTQKEVTYYSRIYQVLDGDRSEIIAPSKVSQLLSGAQLSFEDVYKISCICGTSSPSGALNRVQLFRVLKLIAAAQAGIPPTAEVLAESLIVGLPRIANLSLDESGDGAAGFATDRQSESRDSSPADDDEQVVSPKPQLLIDEDDDDEDDDDDDDEHHQGHHKGWSKFQMPGGAAEWGSSCPLLIEERRHLLGTEEESGGCTEDEGCIPDGVWSMTPEQRAYYAQQFAMLDSKKGKIAGQVAKEFFERSKLPVHELSHIWQLSDVDRDGCLCLEEFSTAMHLVVLRRHQIDIPEVLPSSLVPRSNCCLQQAAPLSLPPPASTAAAVTTAATSSSNLSVVDSIIDNQTARTYNAIAGNSASLGRNVVPPSLMSSGGHITATSSNSIPGTLSSMANAPGKTAFYHPNNSVSGAVSSCSTGVSAASKQQLQQAAATLVASSGAVVMGGGGIVGGVGGGNGGDDDKAMSPSTNGTSAKEWTRFSDDSPTLTSKPANFNFSAAQLAKDPHILHPVARRVSPEGRSTFFLGQNHSASDKDLKPSGLKLSVGSNCDIDGSGPVSFSGVTPNSGVGGFALPPPQKKDVPPPPPPRPQRSGIQHTRSSSLDLNSFGRTNGAPLLIAPPAVPPRGSPGNAAKNVQGIETGEGGLIQEANAVEGDAIDSAHAKQSVPKKNDPGSLLSMGSSSESSFSDDDDAGSYKTDDRACLNVFGEDEVGAGEDWPERRGFTAPSDAKPGSPPPAIRATTIKELPTDQYALMQAVKAHRERSAMLAMLHQELSQELVDVMEERHSLEVQIDTLRAQQQTVPPPTSSSAL